MSELFPAGDNLVKYIAFIRKKQHFKLKVEIKNCTRFKDIFSWGDSF